ncbi:MAG: tryptophan 7-halogenase [Bacteroidetes bacterium]|nr:tryptophan 7-halogenase [Bacteroidota bacterium]
MEVRHLKTDVLVIGAGSAGCTVAAYLKKGNINGIVVEKCTFPRFVIGESLLPSCLDHLDGIVHDDDFLFVMTQVATELGANHLNGEPVDWQAITKKSLVGLTPSIISLLYHFDSHLIRIYPIISESKSFA